MSRHTVKLFSSYKPPVNNNKPNLCNLYPTKSTKYAIIRSLRVCHIFQKKSNTDLLLSLIQTKEKHSPCHSEGRSPEESRIFFTKIT